MRYYSTRGLSEFTTAAEAIKQGLAPDGGLFVPADRPAPFKTDRLPAGSYGEIAAKIFKLYLSGFEESILGKAVDSAYSETSFGHPVVTPLRRLAGNLHVLELWHGPTSAFKDIALQILPHFMRAAIRITGENKDIVILTATSGDTGKSALEGFRDVPGTRIIVYYPRDGVSEVQQLQMTTQEGNNVAVAAVKGNFDDTQKGVKEIFSSRDLAARLADAGYRLSSANSINWGRLVPQIVYYFAAYRDLVGRGEVRQGDKVNFVVPTGNFGNILAGYYARELGLPVNRMICAANRNNVLTDFINTGRYQSRRPLHRTFSPSMDILVSSNLERLLFELSDHEAGRVAAWMEQLRETGEYILDPEILRRLQDLFWSDFADDRETLQAIGATYREHNYLIDTHTAVGRAVLDKYTEREKDDTVSVILSTASPYKFTGSVTRALFGDKRFEGVTELELLKLLSRETGTAIPPDLAKLEQKPIRHRREIDREEMAGHLLEILKL